MNIVQKVNNREIVPRHNNYQEVTVDAAGAGPIINFNGVHARNSGLPGFSPIKQVSGEFEKDQELKNKAPEKDWWDKAKDWGHTALDVAGMIPVVGVAADGANALWYGAEGDYLNAGLSALAAIPGVGQAATTAKLAKKGVSYGKTIGKTMLKNPVSTAVDVAMGADLAQAELTGEEGLVNRDFGYNLKHSGVSPFFGDDEGQSGITNPFTGKEASALFPHVGEKIGKWDAKDNKEGNYWEQFKGGVTGGSDDDKPTTTQTPVETEETPKKEKPKKEKPNYLKYRDKMKKLQKDRGFNLKY